MFNLIGKQLLITEASGMDRKLFCNTGKIAIHAKEAAKKITMACKGILI